MIPPERGDVGATRLVTGRSMDQEDELLSLVAVKHNRKIIVGTQVHGAVRHVTEGQGLIRGYWRGEALTLKCATLVLTERGAVALQFGGVVQLRGPVRTSIAACRTSINPTLVVKAVVI